MTEVPIARNLCGRLSETKVMPAPSSAAKPIPAINRNSLYRATS
ncbi:hypothetical protein [Mucilaginibacter sp.]|nr:hypothetical protein [Mucilaginibacter sp.]